MEQFSQFCMQLLPFLGVIALLLLIIVLFFLIKTIKQLPQSLASVNSMLDDAAHKLSELDAPIQAVKTISQSVDNGFKKGTAAVGSVVGKTKGTVSSLKKAVKGFLKR